MGNLFSYLKIEVNIKNLGKGVIQMSESGKEDILVMAILIVAKDDVLSCANELGIPKEQVTDDVIELVKKNVSQGLGDWREVVKNIVKETIKKDTSKCPLGLTCSPSCAWREAGECTLHQLPQ